MLTSRDFDLDGGSVRVGDGIVSLSVMYCGEDIFPEDWMVHFPTSLDALEALLDAFRSSDWTLDLRPGNHGGQMVDIYWSGRTGTWQPKQHRIHDICLAGRLGPSRLLADVLIHNGLCTPIHQLTEDNFGMVDESDQLRMYAIVEHLSTLDVEAFKRFEQVAWAELAFRRMIRWYCHPDPLVRDAADMKLKLATLERVRAGERFSRRERHAYWELKRCWQRMRGQSLPEFLFDAGTPAKAVYMLEPLPSAACA